MATEQENIISNMSYTNKDFGAIYPELLDLVKKLAWKYDPSISNESDPGVILVKLNAIIADKNNYNTDKAVLETFPVSVTQEYNARNLLNQLGYRMKWYRSATTNLSVQWNGNIEEGISSYKVPVFTMVSNDENEFVYTIIGPEGTDGPTDFLIPANKKAVVVTAMEGTINNYSINGAELIKFSSLDENRRLYFHDPMIAENGIFICSSDDYGNRQNDYSNYKMTDNLSVVPNNAINYYEFGVLRDGTCYIEFPENAETFFGNGIYISYIKTSGVGGNVSAKFLKQFYTTTVATKITGAGEEVTDESTGKVTLTTDNVLMTNTLPATNGEDKENIDEGYNNYKKNVGVFNTLVSLRDYMDYINSTGLVSNSFVCDRTNDVQNSYKAITENDGRTDKYLYVEESGSPSAPTIDAFDLKLYCLTPIGTSVDANEFNKSFTMVYSTDIVSRSVTTSPELDEIKSIPHNFKDISTEKICYIKNVFDLGVRIIPQTKVTELQAYNIKVNVVLALLNAFNAKNVNFGEAASYDNIYNTILEADPSIKSVVLDDIVYKTYAYYFYESSGDYILNYYEINGIPEIDGIISSTGVSGTSGNYYYCEGDGYVYKCSGGTTYTKDVQKSFQVEIFAKSVLNGNTQLLVKDEQFDYSLDQNYDSTIEDITSITTNTNLTFPSNPTTITLKENEGVVVYTPSYFTKEEYSNYVKVLTNKQFNANEPTALGSNDFVVIYWRESDSDVSYRYRWLSEGNKIEVTESLSANDGGQGKPSYVTAPNGYAPTTETSAIKNNGISTDTEYNYGGLTTFSGTKILKVVGAVEVTFDSTDNKKFYWVLNNKTIVQNVNNTNKEYYVLFEAGGQDTYILQTGEYLFYTNSSMSELNILYPGTLITRSNNNDRISCEAVSIDNLRTEGATSIQDYWVTLPSDVDVSFKEMKYYGISGEGNTVTISGLSSSITLTNQVSPISRNATITLTPTDGDPIEVDGSTEDDRYIKSVLLYRSSPTKPMVLNDSRQSIVFTNNTTTEKTGNSSSPLYILSDYEYDLDGGQNIDVQRLTVGGDIEKMAVYVYVKDSDGVDHIASKTQDGWEISIDRSDGDTQTKAFKLKVPDGHYIIPLVNNSPAFSSLKVSTDGGTTYVADLYGTDDSDYKDSGTYFLKFDTPTPNAVITFTIYFDFLGTVASGKYTITLGELYRYDKPSEVESITTFNAILDKVISLDNKSKFNYLYQVPTDDEIKDPLDGESFVNDNHCYNPYTICQMNTKSFDSGIKVLNIKK